MNKISVLFSLSLLAIINYSNCMLRSTFSLSSGCRSKYFLEKKQEPPVYIFSTDKDEMLNNLILLYKHGKIKIDDLMPLVKSRILKDINLRDNRGNTLLHNAVLDLNQKAIIELVKEGAQTSPRNDVDMTPRDILEYYLILNTVKKYNHRHNMEEQKAQSMFQEHTLEILETLDTVCTEVKQLKLEQQKDKTATEAYIS